jgi:hypothetical protein
VRVGRTLARARSVSMDGSWIGGSTQNLERLCVHMGMIMYVYLCGCACVYCAVVAGGKASYIHTYVKGENVHVTQRRLTCRFAS